MKEIEELGGISVQEDGSNRLLMFNVEYTIEKDKATAHLFGVFQEGATIKDIATVHVTLNNFHPFLYLELPFNCDPYVIISEVKRLLPVINAQLVYKGKGYGFHNGDQFPFLKITFRTCNTMKAGIEVLEDKLRSILQTDKVHIYHTDQPTWQLERDGHAGSFQWLYVNNVQLLDDCAGASYCKYNFSAHVNHVVLIPEADWPDVPQYMQYCTWDTETNGLEYGVSEAFIVVAHINTLVPHSKPLMRKAFYHGPEIELLPEHKALLEKRNEQSGCDLDIIHCKSQQDMYDQFAIFALNNSAIICGYNNNGFDTRMMLSNHPMVQFDRLKYSYQKRIWLSDNLNVKPVLPGTPSVDCQVCVQDIKKLRSYKLRNVAAELLNDNKDEMDHKYIIEAWRLKNPKMIGHVLVYCDQDVHVTVNLCDKFNFILASGMYAKISHLPFSKSACSRVTAKVYAHLSHVFDECGFVINIPRKKWGDAPDAYEGYEGAVVLEPATGYYQDELIGCGDFDSLYPNEARKHKLCMSTCRFDKSKTQYEGLAGVDYHSVEDNHFAYNPSLPTPPCCLMFDRLLNRRVTIKDEMKLMATNGLKNTAAYGNKDAFQTAVKLLGNGGYGFFAYQLSDIPCKPMARYITLKGQEHIHMGVSLFNAMFGSLESVQHLAPMEGVEGVEVGPSTAKVVYGDTDSIMCYFDPRQVQDKLPTEEQFPNKDWTNKEYYLRRRLYAVSSLMAAFTTELSKQVGINMKDEGSKYNAVMHKKKMYAAMVFEKPTDKGKLVIKGLVVVKRDVPIFIAEYCGELLNLLCVAGDSGKAITLVQTVCTMLLDHKIPLHKYQVAKSVNKEEYASTNIAHVNLHQREKRENPDEMQEKCISYVILEAPKSNPKLPLSQRAELVSKVNGRRVDTEYYLDWWGRVATNIMDHVNPAAIHDIMTVATMEHQRRKHNQRTLFECAVTVAKGTTFNQTLKDDRIVKDVATLNKDVLQRKRPFKTMLEGDDVEEVDLVMPKAPAPKKGMKRKLDTVGVEGGAATESTTVRKRIAINPFSSF